MVRGVARTAITTFAFAAAAAGGLFFAPRAAASDYACNFVEIQCDRAANLVRIVPFRAENEECDRLRALKNTEWLVDVARHVSASGKDRGASAAPKVVRCELAAGRSVSTIVQGLPVEAKPQGPCAAMFSAIVSIEEQQPHPRRVLNNLNLLQDCQAGGAADRIEYSPESQKLLIQWSSEKQFGVLERTVLARQRLQQSARGR
jgi:hypothetical protein